VQLLRDEILGSQQVRSDLLKWKLVAVGALGATGLGLAGAETSGHADLVLCAVPLVSVYIDLLCRHLSLRILVIGSYLGTLQGSLSERKELALYERFAERARRLNLNDVPPESGDGERADVFALEEWALSWSSAAISLGVLGYGIGVWIDSSLWPFAFVFALSGITGFVATLGARHAYRRRAAAVRALGSVDQGSRT
jgi:hypothetical protein